MKTSTTFPSLPLITGVALFCLAVCGCQKSSTTIPVKGQVLLADGSPAKGGTVEFRTTDDEGNTVNASGQIEPDGSFQLTTFAPHDGVLPGKHQAILLNPSAGEGESPAAVAIFPRKYERYDTSGLEVVVDAGSSEVVIQTAAR